MTDYTVAISGSTSLMIRDLGNTVEYWMKTGTQTWNNEQPWSYFVNGYNSPTQHFRMVRGGNWQFVASFSVTYDQDVRFTLINSGLGFPTYDFVVHIQRSTVPQPPTMQSVTPISSSAFHVFFTGNYDGGSAIVEWQIGYGINSSYPTDLAGSGGMSDIGGFSPGQRGYFWARARNAVGWSGWSNRLDAVTWNVPDAPNPLTVPIASSITQITALVQFSDQGDGGQPILQREIGYGKNSSAPTDFQDAIVGANLLTDLDPGKRYFLWARSRNSIGWGPYSERSFVLLIAGAQILDGVEWKRAVPYMKVDGEWKVVQPWVKNQGIWRTTA